MATEENVEEYPVADLASLLAVNDAAEEWVSVPEWKMKVKVKSISKADQVLLRKQSSFRGDLDPAKMEQLLFVYGVAEPKLEREHLDRLFQKHSGAVDRILHAILKVSGMTSEAAEEAEADFQE